MIKDQSLSSYLNHELNNNEYDITDCPCSITDKYGYEAKIICDSINQYGSRLTTITARYPRFVHSELMTHREFSRNAASSRAIPISKVIEQVRENPAMPYKWQKNQKGMQGGEEFSNQEIIALQNTWTNASMHAIYSVQSLTSKSFGSPHKQVANRLLEPFVWMTTVISSTNWNNFFHLRCNDLADPTIRHIAEMIRYVIENNEPKTLGKGKWHLPFVNSSETSGEDLKQISVARCARISYLNHESKNIEKDLELATSLERNGHWSAFEHVATPSDDRYQNIQNGNFDNSWFQYRKLFRNEYVR